MESLDLARATAEDWTRILHGVDVGMNAAGALQDRASEDLEAIHVRLIERLLPALGGRRLARSARPACR